MAMSQAAKKIALTAAFFFIKVNEKAVDPMSFLLLV